MLAEPRIHDSTQQNPKDMAWFVGRRAHSGVEKKIRWPGTYQV